MRCVLACLILSLASLSPSIAGGDCCLDYGDCYAQLKACKAQGPVEITKVVKEPCPKPAPCPKAKPCETCADPGYVTETIVERVEVEKPQPRNALGGGLAAFWLPDFSGDHDVEYGPALSYERIWSKWVLHAGVSAAEVPVSNTVLDYCSGYGGGGGHYYPCLSTMTDDEWLYQANLMFKRRF